MKFITLVREETEVQTVFDKANADGHLERFDITAHEAPLDVMDKGLESLAPLCKQINELASVESITPYGVKVKFTQHGTRSTSVLFSRVLTATGKKYKDKTPYFQIDDSADGEEGERECSVDQAALVVQVIDAGTDYAKGKRKQQLLPLDEKAEPEGGTNQDPDLFDGDKEEE